VDQIRRLKINAGGWAIFTPFVFYIVVTKLWL
jgi:hypothetical protein